MIGEQDRRFRPVPGAVRIGDARRVERVAGMQDRVAQRQRSARPPRHAIEDDCTFAGAEMRTRAKCQCGRSRDEPEQRIGERPEHAEHAQQLSRNGRHAQAERFASQSWMVCGTSFCARPET